LARARDLPLDEVATSVTTRLARDDDGHDHELAVQIRSGASEDAVRGVVHEAEARCPVCRALAGNVPMTVSLEIVRSD